ncbi:MAG: hypothetical protein BWZ01_00602 [Deltaproteobacteria bacterium ADurb.BinA179]|nr:MAG: hypothetical protein BWZ01_00602 [Deltaproteobacteria bacterium ADurb.BinA179]
MTGRSGDRLPLKPEAGNITENLDIPGARLSIVL